LRATAILTFATIARAATAVAPLRPPPSRGDGMVSPAQVAAFIARRLQARRHVARGEDGP